MKPLVHYFRHALWIGAALGCSATSSFAAATLMQQVDPNQVNVGEQVVVTLTVQGGTVGEVNLPPVDGLKVAGTQSATNITFSNGTFSRSLSLNYSLIPSRVGDLVIPAFDIRTQEGEMLHVKAITIHVIGAAPPPSTNSATSVSAPAQGINPAFNAGGPVVMPPTSPPLQSTPPNFETGIDTSDSYINAPRENDGTAAKVFLSITPQTTDAFVGQSIPLRIDFFIRLDVNADQNSLPTINGSDFLMNSFTTRGQPSIWAFDGQQYERESWVTAISAPKSGDFPLVMTRDSYWVKSVTNTSSGFFGQYFNPRPNLAHEPILSNQLVMHIHALPAEGRPEHFTGAIGQFQATGQAEPATVDVGEPVTLHFTVSGNGNFDYVRCPFVPADPSWKSYVPSSKISYQNEPHTRATKTFSQSIIPNKNGVLSLPEASFSYFDPADKKYVTVPILLPPITVTGSVPPAASPSTDANENGSAGTAPNVLGFLPNRADMGSPRMNLTPVYRQSWFWIAQAGLAALPLLGILFHFVRSRAAMANDLSDRELHARSLKQEEDAMSDAVLRNDPVAFFLSARHAVQLQLGALWNVKPEALTLGEIRKRDPELADNLRPLFVQADEVIYSGRPSSNLDLAEWDRITRGLLTLQPA